MIRFNISRLYTVCLFVCFTGRNNCTQILSVASVRPIDGFSAGFKYVETLSRIIIGGPYPPSNAIICMHLLL